MYYTVDIAGMKRDLQLYPIGPDLQIAAFILFGDVEITQHAAKELLKRSPEFDIVITAEAKSIPLAYEFAKQAGRNDYVVARKGMKVYMDDPIEAKVNSITTQKTQTLYLGQDDVDKLAGKRVLIVDDVVSTGDSLRATEMLIEQAGGNIVGKMFVLAEGAAADRDDVVFLGKLPMFDGKGNEI